MRVLEGPFLFFFFDQDSYVSSSSTSEYDHHSISIRNPTESDAGYYLCRVNFTESDGITKRFEIVSAGFLNLYGKFNYVSNNSSQ